MSKNLLILFVKNLIPGTVKTRLAEEIGIEGALDVYQFLVEHTFEETNKVESDKIVYYSEYVEIEDIFDNGKYQMQVQKGKDLGERMLNAFQKSFDAGYEKAIIVGSDCFELQKTHIEEALDELDKNDLVIGPASDGGYYLLGMKELFPALFQNKKFSHENVLKELLAEIASLDLSFHLLPELNDIDTFDDLKDSGIDFEFVSDDD
ncbi:TIGR04282 family arsenosugar biosynthesis glycosyltransferase [Marinoscillum sp. MHG1-6]|uniref:TIGR04282 family arsenosugar biosynthesis glycosyltransferase n=1 Tax=Marinoscillum sp. MHG1-6 TaxID=2959627 RepID=UPI002158A092|nr:TIGR04282 family arsenosugar biosynthesis glycosyltransferase [Marinoscillum sp. MHG1-6]